MKIIQFSGRRPWLLLSIVVQGHLTVFAAGPVAPQAVPAAKPMGDRSVLMNNKPRTPAVGARSPASNLAGEQLMIDPAKQNYWEMTDSEDAKAVQNRMYSRSSRLELGAFYGITSSDPFLSISNLGGKIGFNISEVFQLHVIAWKHTTVASSALKSLESVGTTTNTNPPSLFTGGGLEISPVYGKISLLGLTVLHYDLFFDLGGGVTTTESGKYPTAYVGIGQVFYLARFLALRMDYRMTFYNEQIYEKVDPARIGQLSHTQLNRGDLLVAGFSLFL
jgi:outer membrane beta-barrel protein